MKVRKAVIPAAGLGTRMLPATKTVPKEMLPVVDKPLLQYIVEEAVAAGIEDILLVTSRAKSAMDDYFDYHPELEERLEKAGRHEEAQMLRRTSDLANIVYVRQKQTLGLGHAIWRAKSFVGDEPFAVLLGDDIMKSDVPVTGQLIRAAELYGCSCVGIQHVPMNMIHKYCSLDVSPLGGSVYDVKGLVEKPRPEQVLSDFAILGRYVITPAIFEILENQPAGYGGEIQLTDGLNTLCARERLVGVNFDARRYDAGNLCGYMEVCMDFALEHRETAKFMREYIKDKVKEL